VQFVGEEEISWSLVSDHVINSQAVANRLPRVSHAPTGHQQIAPWLQVSQTDGNAIPHALIYRGPPKLTYDVPLMSCDDVDYIDRYARAPH